MKKIKVGLLPLYIELYDQVSQHMRPGIEKFYAEIAAELEKRDLDVIQNPVCRLKNEFQAAVDAFEKGGAEAIVTLHLAYSPSLESIDALAGTKLPVIVCDTTPDYLFDCTIDSGAISYNHGIHGVQDMCNMLLRRKKAFQIFAGHYQEDPVLDQVAAAAKLAAAARSVKGMKLGLVGGQFYGMGDFTVSDEDMMKVFGAEVIRYDNDVKRLEAITQAQLDAEYEKDSAMCCYCQVPREEYDKTERLALAIKGWMEEKDISGFSMNFLTAGDEPGWPTMPFSWACKAMAQGYGYAGEGDTLTAMLVAALLKAFPETTFAEMFCPDWKNNHVYFSHMGEFNLKCAKDTLRAQVMPFRFAAGFDPVSIRGEMKPGKVCLVNLSPTAEGFRIVAAEGDILEIPDDLPNFHDEVSAWFDPHMKLTQFLAGYSRLGGTHHSALVYGATAELIEGFAKELGVEFCEVK